ncbi:alpha amylase [Plectosphaerella plurivora]|uniref:Alpha amylase n=1 Tax=Plectosphaerella plurivora TaxID=936078 RepID=A0A9P9A544_9PEZI|nr:alpha amylase [Plectosphaerella plurivora]
MGSATERNGEPWWKNSTVYQIYPASFKDSNNDGLGDIPGILSKVDYLADLGVDVVWVSPMYKSPQFDMGYDISDYEAVHEPYGTVADMEDLISACHARGMRLILDLVINHTSDEHAWFKESRSSLNNQRRDWYIWRPARIDPVTGNRLPPTNWRSYFGGSAWQWDEATGEYYLHLFARQQPDLNWENEACRAAIYDSAMRFWLDRGVDGFRVDTVNMYSKGVELRDAPVVDRGAFEQPAWDMYANGPRIHEFLGEMNTVLAEYGADLMTVGELPHTPDEGHVRRYVSAAAQQLSMVFQFDIVEIGKGSDIPFTFTPWKLPELKQIVERWQCFIEGNDAWTTAFCENHDQGRSVSRYGSDKDENSRELSAKMLSLMLCSLTGTLFVYQGQEIGMVNVPREWPVEEYQDIASVNHYRALEASKVSDESLRQALDGINLLGRDNARTPMQWDSSPHSGFTKSATGPWMRTHDNYPSLNVEKQQSEPRSVLNFWKEMLQVRKEQQELLIHGNFRLLDGGNEESFVFTKTHEGRVAVVVLNFTDHTVEGRWSGLYGEVNEMVSLW